MPDPHSEAREPAAPFYETPPGASATAGTTSGAAPAAPRAPGLAPEAEERLAAVLARLDERVDWERRDRGAFRPGLDSMTDLAARLGNPHERLRVVHVAGTKGKGSVAALVAEGLRSASLAVGVYASPHVSHVTERVRLRGASVAPGVLAEALEAALDARAAAEREGTAAAGATWFDLVTAAAFRIFASAGLDWAVIEVGLGGRLDSTNVVRPEVCVITNIDLEHTQVLGSTRGRIAAEKAGILKPGAALVTGLGPDPERTGEEDAWAVVSAATERLRVPVRRVEVPAEASIDARNLALARAVLAELGARGARGADGTPIGPELLDPAAHDRARLPGRLELLRARGTPVLVDGAHTPASVAAVVRELARRADLPGRPVVILALGREKDAAGVLKALTGRVDRVICTTVATGPLRRPEELAELARPLFGTVVAVPDAAAALDAALRGSGDERWVLAIGSLWLAGGVRAAITSDTGPR